MRGKTDRVDAELLARMVAHEHTKLHAWVPPSPEQDEMAQLIKRRANLSSLRAALGMSLKGLNGFSTDLKALKKRFDQVMRMGQIADHDSTDGTTCFTEATAPWLAGQNRMAPRLAWLRIIN